MRLGWPEDSEHSQGLRVQNSLHPLNQTPSVCESQTWLQGTREGTFSGDIKLFANTIVGEGPGDQSAPKQGGEINIICAHWCLMTLLIIAWDLSLLPTPTQGKHSLMYHFIFKKVTHDKNYW